MFCGRFKKLRISLFARTTLKTAARAGVSFWSSGFIKKLGISLFARSTMKTAGASPWISWFVKKLGISLFGRTIMKTAARAVVSFHAATAVAPIRKDEASKEDSIHVVSYEKGQRREHDIEVDKSKPVVPDVQDVEITVVPVVVLALVTEKASLGLVLFDCLWE